jgi:actin-related protein
MLLQVFTCLTEGFCAWQLAQDTTCVQRTYTLPHGGCIRLGAERFMAPEALFRPSLLNVESPGIAELAFQCIQVVAPPALVRLKCLLQSRYENQHLKTHRCP